MSLLNHPHKISNIFLWLRLTSFSASLNNGNTVLFIYLFFLVNVIKLKSISLSPCMICWASLSKCGYGIISPERLTGSSLEWSDWSKRRRGVKGTKKEEAVCCFRIYSINSGMVFSSIYILLLSTAISQILLHTNTHLQSYQLIPLSENTT